MKLEGAHLLELFLHSATTFERQLDQFGYLLLGKLPVRVDQFDQTRNGLPHRFDIT
jgi:hypothetical protein